jgi:hypothetical protein
MKRMHYPQESQPEKASLYDPLDSYEDWVRPLRAHWPNLFPPLSKAGESNAVKGPRKNHGCHRHGG